MADEKPMSCAASGTYILITYYKLNDMNEINPIHKFHSYIILYSNSWLQCCRTLHP